MPGGRSLRRRPPAGAGRAPGICRSGPEKPEWIVASSRDVTVPSPNLITQPLPTVTPDCSSLVRMAARSTGKDAPPNPKKNQTPAPDLDDPSLYVNRELGLFSFQWRVVGRGGEKPHPLLRSTTSGKRPVG